MFGVNLVATMLFVLSGCGLLSGVVFQSPQLMHLSVAFGLVCMLYGCLAFVAGGIRHLFTPTSQLVHELYALNLGLSVLSFDLFSYSQMFTPVSLLVTFGIGLIVGSTLVLYRFYTWRGSPVVILIAIVIAEAPIVEEAIGYYVFFVGIVLVITGIYALYRLLFGRECPTDRVVREPK